MEWMEEIPTNSEESPSMGQNRVPKGVQMPPDATKTTDFQRPNAGNKNQLHSIRKRNSRDDLREEDQLGTPSSKPSSRGCHPC